MPNQLQASIQVHNITLHGIFSEKLHPKKRKLKKLHTKLNIFGCPAGNEVKQLRTKVILRDFVRDSLVTRQTCHSASLQDFATIFGTDKLAL